ncbi:sensor histidine kinase [Paenibacillus caui]|uniref:sensor histidine kinase n=1 Tax=Paenibacillus caui TaxID=2873927 RepID=UPI001CA9DF2B|nr:sensor histidine kinase [Paenibacillus caui]
MPDPSSTMSRKLNIVPFVFLVYLTSPVIALLQEPPAVKLPGLCLLAVFAFCYVHGFLVPRFRFANMLILVAIFSYLSLVSDPYMMLMGFFSAALLSQMPSGKLLWLANLVEIAAFIVIILGTDRQFMISNWPALLPPFIVIVLFPFGLRIFQKSRVLKEQLSIAKEEIARLSKIEERQRISRDLHDTLGHTLSLITLKSELAEKLVPKAPERAVLEIKDVQKAARAALQQVRELVADMRSMSVKDEFPGIKEMLSAAGIALTLKDDGEISKAPPLTQNILGLCLKEAINNVVKHSGATECDITLRQSPQEWRLTVSDNGHGSISKGSGSTETVTEDAVPIRKPFSSTGRGLLGMQERLKLIQGKLVFTSLPDQGSTLEIRIPRVLKEQID